MNYAQFRTFRDEILARGDFLRLDCMNPARALSALTPPTGDEPATAEMALSAWRSLFAPDVDARWTAAGTGVRSLLRVVFAHLAESGRDLWLPADVYPEYGNLAAEAGLRCHSLITLPELDLAPLSAAGPRSALLLPQPLAPLGRSLTADEGSFLHAWLGEAPERRLVLDTVYHFVSSLDPLARSLCDGGQTYLLHSIAKGWLLPDTLGVLLLPPREAPLKERTSAPDPVAAGRAIHALRSRPQMPVEVEATFRRQWAALAGRIRAAVPGWQPPATGYFSVVPVPFTELLQRHQALAVPASVFGSARADLSILSCLYSPA
jgi:hypothetical protein